MDENVLWSMAETVPPEWYASADDELQRLVEQLIERRGRVRELIQSFRKSNREPFPNWEERTAVSM
jgi:hypothetical protein